PGTPDRKAQALPPRTARGRVPPLPVAGARWGVPCSRVPPTNAFENLATSGLGGLFPLLIAASRVGVGHAWIRGCDQRRPCRRQGPVPAPRLPDRGVGPRPQA